MCCSTPQVRRTAADVPAARSGRRGSCAPQRTFPRGEQHAPVAAVQPRGRLVQRGTGANTAGRLWVLQLAAAATEAVGLQDGRSNLDAATRGGGQLGLDRPRNPALCCALTGWRTMWGGRLAGCAQRCETVQCCICSTSAQCTSPARHSFGVSASISCVSWGRRHWRCWLQHTPLWRGRSCARSCPEGGVGACHSSSGGGSSSRIRGRWVGGIAATAVGVSVGRAAAACRGAWWG
jgi:hypothetical protein